MVKMRAKKRFHVQGSRFKEVGEVFSVAEARASEYEALNIAERVEEKEQQEDLTPSEQVVESKEDNLEQKTVSELRDIAKDKDISGYSRMNKTQLINAIMEADEND